MNKLIKKFAEQADPHYAGIYDDDMGHALVGNEAIEKFAELIVRECADLFVDQRYMILNPHEPFANERIRALKEHDKDTVKKIKRHFGVEL